MFEVHLHVESDRRNWYQRFVSLLLQFVAVKSCVSRTWYMWPFWMVIHSTWAVVQRLPATFVQSTYTWPLYKHHSPILSSMLLSKLMEFHFLMLPLKDQRSSALWWSSERSQGQAKVARSKVPTECTLMCDCKRWSKEKIYV